MQPTNHWKWYNKWLLFYAIWQSLYFLAFPILAIMSKNNKALYIIARDFVNISCFYARLDRLWRLKIIKTD